MKLLVKVLWLRAVIACFDLAARIADRRKTGRVFYDPLTQRLFQVKGARAGFLVCGSFCKYYDDARRQTNLIQLSRGYVAGCREVVCLDKTEEVHYDGIGWRVKYS